MRYLRSRARGFSIVELLVVIGILLVLITLFVGYSRRSEAQFLLLRDRAAITGMVLKSKTLAISTFRRGGRACGYGVHFESDHYTLFKDEETNFTSSGGGSPLPNCASSLVPGTKYTGSAEDVQLEVLDNRVELEICNENGIGNITACANTGEVRFVPPDPQVFLDPGNNLADIVIFIRLKNTNEQLTVRINRFGQVST